MLFKEISKNTGIRNFKTKEFLKIINIINLSRTLLKFECINKFGENSSLTFYRSMDIKYENVEIINWRYYFGIRR